MTDRINARLDPELARKVKYLRERTGQSTSAVVKASIAAYYERLAGADRPADLLGSFVGCANGPADLATSYKDQLSNSLKRKIRS